MEITHKEKELWEARPILLWDVPLPAYAKMLRMTSRMKPAEATTQTRNHQRSFGIYRADNKFRATVLEDGKRIILGRVETKEEALELQKKYAKSVGKKLIEVVSTRKKKYE